MVIARQLRRPELEGELVELAGEAERHLVVLVVHGRARIDAHVEGFVDRHEERNGVRDFLGGDFLVVHLQDAGAAFAEAGAIVFEVEHDGVLARRERVLAFPAEPLEIEEVVEEHRLALEQIKAIATEAATQGDDHSFGAALRNVHFGGDRIGLVQDARVRRCSGRPDISPE